jgi:hypothetical protein
MMRKMHKAITVVYVALIAAMLGVAAQATASGANTIGNCNLPIWCPVSTPNQSGSNLLYGTTALSNNDAWAVGLNIGATASPITQHWDGNTWTAVTPASVPADAGFRSVSANATDDIWAVGFDNYVGDVQLTLAQHWNGSSWSTVTTPNGDNNAGNILAGVVAVSIINVWTVGNYNTTVNRSINYTLVEHWGGTAWSQVASPSVNPGTSFNTLNAVAAVSATDIWAVGDYANSIYTDAPHPLIEHWDGTSWSIPSNLPNPGLDSVLYGVAAFSANDVWAVGAINPYGTPRPLIVHWDGTSWSVATSLPPVNGGQLQGITITPQHDIWAVGSRASVPLVMHWQGGGNINAWVTFPAAYPHIAGGLLSVASPLVPALGGNNNIRMWAVGYSSDGNTYYTLADTYAPLVNPAWSKPGAAKKT